MKKIWKIYRQWRDRRLRERCVKYAIDGCKNGGMVDQVAEYCYDFISQTRHPCSEEPRSA